jgi:pimeloyl-ACP methyl ester carboxylesterase
MKSVQLSTGIAMAYAEAGSPSKDVVIFLHGYTDTHLSFQETMEELARLNPNRKLYALDQRGHGESSMPPEKECATDPEQCFNASLFAKDVIAFMAKLKISTAYIVGHSMGSVIAQEVALTYPKRVRGIVLIGSFANAKGAPVIQDYLIDGQIEGKWKPSLERISGFNWPIDAYMLRPIEMDAEISSWIKTEWVYYPTVDDDLIAAIYNQTMQIRLGTWIGAIKALSRVDNLNRLSDCKVSTLVLWALQDAAFPEPVQIELQTALEKAKKKNGIVYSFKNYGKKPLPDSGMQEDDLGHNLQWAAAVEVAGDIDSFIRTGKPLPGIPFANPASIKSMLVE